MTDKWKRSTGSTVRATTLLGFLCGLVAVAVFALWWQVGPNSVSCYYASYEPGDDSRYGEMAAKMWPTRWLWIGLLAAPTVAGGLFGFLGTRLGLRLERRAR
ncbi:hypothetical protein APR12_003411 [Nocardia amikacinitolerans]|uniref:hypothetical protein n=1 Tax=Nocardia amikacinitolerans TaxID=756689 RepID=UPI0008336FF8|nr:hypothetical protein [Nocardia amikacinitolerans]MCP2318058.1 hypothetical protein [Nocardia amikacinitolerans]